MNRDNAGYIQGCERGLPFLFPLAMARFRFYET